MFSMKSTWKEIKTTKPVDTALGDLFPTCWSILLQGHEEETMEQIHDRVHMEWGEAFWSQPLVNCANMLMETAEKQKFLFVPLWHTQKEGWIPKEDQNDEGCPNQKPAEGLCCLKSGERQSLNLEDNSRKVLCG